MKKDMGIIILAIALAAIAGLYFKSKEFREISSEMKSEEMSMEESQEYTMQTEEIEPQKNEVPNKEEYKAYFENAKFITVEKVERTIVEDGEGNAQTSYDTYLVSDVSLSNGTDKTDSYAKAMADGKFDEALIESVDFTEAFGTSYAGKDGEELLVDLLTENGFSTDFAGLTFDKDTYELTGQNTFLLENCAVLEKLLESEVDEVIKKEAYVQVMEDKEGNKIPEFFSAQVQYQKGGKTITKSVYLQVTVNDYSGREEV